MRKVDPSLRFWNKVDKRGMYDCWEWRACVGSDGYGQIKVGKRAISAPQLAFQLSGRSVPEGHEVCHLCDNRLCVNPLHLYAGTRIDNTRDTFRGDGGCRRLSNEDVREIRRLHKMDRHRIQHLADRFGCHRDTISRVLSGWTFSYIY